MNRFAVSFHAIGALSARPKLLAGLIRLMMVVTLVTLLAASLYQQTAFNSLRAFNMGAIADAFALRDVKISLIDALAAERAARLARSEGELRAATAQFERAASDALGLLRAPPSGAGATRLAATGLPGEVADALDTLRRLVPARPGLLSPAADAPIIEIPCRLADRISTDMLVHRRVNIRRITRSERIEIAAPLATLTLFVVLLGGTTNRLIEGSQRLIAARREATEQAQLLRAAVDHMRDGVAVFDADGDLLLSNTHLGPTAGLPEPLTRPGTPFREVAASLARGDPPLLELDLAHDAPVSGEMRLGKRVLAVFRSAMPNGGQMLTVSDVTERIAAEELVRRAQRMDVLGRLTGGVAHDFNNLLQALSANLEVMSAALARRDEPQLAVLAGEALGAVERGTRLTRHLLAFARRQELASTAIDTEAVLRALRDLLARTLGDTIDVELSIAPGLWPVFADPAGLENALLNLALNGRDAMPTGGRLAISARNVADPDGERVRIEVLDEGVGMTDEQVARAVEPFYTTKGIGAGLGLGLSLVDGFARQSGGRFHLDSEFGRGTCASLDMPRAVERPVQILPVASVERGAGETVLLVEDDPVVSRASREALEQIGYRVVEAADALAACRLLEDDGLQPDLVFTDVMMPGPLDVADLVRRVRTLLPDIPILFNTGDVEARVLARVTFDERTTLLAKPWRVAEMSRQIRALLDSPAPVLALSKPA